MTNTSIADQQTTIEHYLNRSAREGLPLHRTFLQQKKETGQAPGPGAAFVHRNREGALDQYLFLHALASAPDPETGRHDVRLRADIWARAGGGHFDPVTGRVEKAALHAVSRNWQFLRANGLVTVERVKRLARVTLLADDGSGEDYEHVGDGMRGRRLARGDAGYFQLPYAYWRAGWNTELSLVGKAVLLIALSLGDGFPLPANKGPEWYGMSASTIERGIRELRNNRLLHSEKLRRTDPESPVGFTDLNYYELRPPFGPRRHRASNAHDDFVGTGGLIRR
jgi:hypothetical protein